MATRGRVRRAQVEPHARMRLRVDPLAVRRADEDIDRLARRVVGRLGLKVESAQVAERHSMLGLLAWRHVERPLQALVRDSWRALEARECDRVEPRAQGGTVPR